KIIDFYRDYSDGYPNRLGPLEQRLALDVPGESPNQQARRKAALMAALAALGKGDHAWRALVHTADPTLRSYLIERLVPAGVDANDLKQRLSAEDSASAHQAIILALGAFPVEPIPDLAPELARLYEFDADAGIRSAAGWVLRVWTKDERLPAI